MRGWRSTPTATSSYRVLSNLCRNAVQALESGGERRKATLP